MEGGSQRCPCTRLSGLRCQKGFIGMEKKEFMSKMLQVGTQIQSFAATSASEYPFLQWLMPELSASESNVVHTRKVKRIWKEIENENAWKIVKLLLNFLPILIRKRGIQYTNMAKVFFPRSLLGRKIEFANSESSWILDHKILERYVQNQYELDPKPCWLQQRRWAHPESSHEDLQTVY
jgi:hypothetical protein